MSFYEVVKQRNNVERGLFAGFAFAANCKLNRTFSLEALKKPAEDLSADRQAAVSRLLEGSLEPAVYAGYTMVVNLTEHRNLCFHATFLSCTICLISGIIELFLRCTVKNRFKL